MAVDGSDRLQIRLFGKLEVLLNGAPVPDLQRRHSGEALVALILLAGNNGISAIDLADYLYADEVRTPSMVGHCIGALRQALGAEGWRIKSRPYAIDLTGADVDVIRFADGIWSDNLDEKRQAVELYAGDLLEGWKQPWIERERQKRRRMLGRALDRLIPDAIEREDWDRAKAFLELQISLLPADNCIAELRSLLQTVQQHRVGRMAGEIVARAEPAETHSPNSKELEPSHLAQPILPQRVLPQRVLPQLVLPQHNLPNELTSFVGREKEIAALKAALDSYALLTLTGSGGCGKTRLALRVAREALPHYADGVRLVELATVSDPLYLTQAVASALGLREDASPLALQTLIDHLRFRSQRLLLILDNCEHLLPAIAALAETLLKSCSDLRILATSRELLNIPGERAWRVPSLQLPDMRRLPPGEAEQAEFLLKHDAIRLFVDRAGVQQPEFALKGRNAAAVAAICGHLDGIPLAIELAAARLRSLSAEEINRRLDERFRLLTNGSRTALPRHQTLRSLIDWSYDLLTEPEKQLLQRLAVFAGGWTLAAAEQVCCGGGILAADILTLLMNLEDKSLIMHERMGEQVRYRLLETIRQYAADKHAANGEEARLYRVRHRDYFLALALEVNPKLGDADQVELLNLLEAEHGNLNQALRFCLENAEEIENGLRLAAALQQFWWTRGYVDQGRRWFQELLTHSLAQAPTKMRADALNGAAVLARMQADYISARLLQEECLFIYRQLKDDFAIAYCLGNLAILAWEMHDYAQARLLQEEGLELQRKLRNDEGIAYCLGNLGVMAWHQRDYAVARARLEESLDILQKLQHSWGIATCLSNLGGLHLRLGDCVAARTRQAQSLKLRIELQDLLGIAACLEAFGALACREDRWELSAQLHGAAERLQEEIGSRLSKSSDEQEEYDLCLRATRQALGEERFARAWTEGRLMTQEQAVQMALQSAAEA
jgi:predicted ATPase